VSPIGDERIAVQIDHISLYRERIGCSIQELAAGLERKVRSLVSDVVCLYRIKNPATLSKKLALKQSKDIASIDDIYGLRLIVGSADEIYSALQLVMSEYPGYLDHDYVARPKKRPDRPGKELRLVQYIARKNDVTFEVQITTAEWNKINEELHLEYHKRQYG
jgi:(p)ppGpp synthase/HD superfamily hydrolase